MPISGANWSFNHFQVKAFFKLSVSDVMIAKTGVVGGVVNL